MPQPVAFVTGADRGLGLALCAGLLERGYRVLAGQYMPDWPELAGLEALSNGLLTAIPLDVSSIESALAASKQACKVVDQVDVLINNAGISSRTNQRTIREPQDYDAMHQMYDVNALGPIRMVEAFYPLIEKSSTRRLCFVSSEAGSIGRAHRTSWFGYCMSKSALNMGVKLLFNDLRPQGFTFRVYHPGWVRSYMSGQKNNNADLEPEEAAAPALNFFLSGLEDNGYPAVDEDHLVLRDYQGNEWPW
jgi:NAD(P)-dependent dehydrogenase (short-subunit alcohol dehydrogenase family)